MQTSQKHSESNLEFLDRLAVLIQRFDKERRERFFPFYIIFAGDKGHRRFKEALSIGKYFLDNAVLNTQKDADFYDKLKKQMEKFSTVDIDYWHFAKKTPIPMQDYLKVVYDL